MNKKSTVCLLSVLCFATLKQGDAQDLSPPAFEFASPPPSPSPPPPQPPPDESPAIPPPPLSPFPPPDSPIPDDLPVPVEAGGPAPPPPDVSPLVNIAGAIIDEWQLSTISLQSENPTAIGGSSGPPRADDTSVASVKSNLFIINGELRGAVSVSQTTLSFPGSSSGK
eukprot:jgi/Botrbrau1/7241/Bobra.0021s0024.1